MCKNFFIVLCSTFLINACVNNLNFDQLEDASNSATFTTSLIFLQINSNYFNETLDEQEADSEITEVSRFSFFEYFIVRENIDSIALNIKVKNEFNIPLKAHLQFLNSLDVVMFELDTLYVEKNTLNTDYLQTVPIHKNELLLNASKVKVMINLPEGSSSLESDTENELILRSSLTYYVRTY